MTRRDRAAPGSVSVIVPAYAAVPHLPAALDAIRRQTRLPDEVIVVRTGVDDPGLEPGSDGFDLRVLHRRQRLPACEARNLGLAEARGDLLVFMDADVLPADERWLERLVATLEERPGCFVAGAVGYARRGGYWGLSLWAIEFSSVHPFLPARTFAGACTANMAARAADVAAVGGFIEGVGSSEDVVLAARLRARGLENRFQPDAAVGHMNISGFAHFADHLWWLGVWSARARHDEKLPGDLVMRLPPLALLLWLYRIGLTCGRAIRWGRGHRLAFAWRLPAIVLGSMIWNAGFLWGLARR